MPLIYLVRHGETDWNVVHRIQGSSDIPLNDTGRRQAERAGTLLARRRWDGLFASPLSRAMDTARIISRHIGLGEPVPLASMMERHYGDAEGLDPAEVQERFPGDTPVPGRETREQVTQRAMQTLHDLAQGREGQKLVIATHGGVIRAVLNAVNAGIDRGVPITNGSIHSFRHSSGAFELIAFDDPIELASVVPGEESIEEQNPVEEREADVA